MAKLHRSYAEAARKEDRYVELDEKEIGETLADWLVQRRGLRPDMAKALAKDLAESWGRGAVEAQTVVDVVAKNRDSCSPAGGRKRG